MLIRIIHVISLAFISEPARSRVFLAVNLTTMFSPLLLQQRRGRRDQRARRELTNWWDAEVELRHQIESAGVSERLCRPRTELELDAARIEWEGRSQQRS